MRGGKEINSRCWSFADYKGLYRSLLYLVKGIITVLFGLIDLFFCTTVELCAKLSSEVKYLGITLDKGLTWKK
jgi:hypothetical protein